MTSLWMKIIMCPLLVGISSLLFWNVDFASVYQPIVIGLILAVVGTAMEYITLSENTVWLSNLLDFGAATLIVYFAALFMDGAAVTFFGAILTALVIGVAEHFVHRYLVARDKTEKAYS